MFDFIRKPLLWDAWTQKLDEEIVNLGRSQIRSIKDLGIYTLLHVIKSKRVGEYVRTSNFQLKTIQDLAVYSQLRGTNGKRIAEIEVVTPAFCLCFQG